MLFGSNVLLIEMTDSLLFVLFTKFIRYWFYFWVSFSHVVQVWSAFLLAFNWCQHLRYLKWIRINRNFQFLIVSVLPAVFYEVKLSDSFLIENLKRLAFDQYDRKLHLSQMSVRSLQQGCSIHHDRPIVLKGSFSRWRTVPKRYFFMLVYHQCKVVTINVFYCIVV